MTDVALRLKDEILRLAPDDRDALISDLLESLGYEYVHEDDAAWLKELERRSADASAGRASEEPFRDVIAELRAEKP
jgi:putative addiction module component (TIGR02574 family)